MSTPVTYGTIVNVRMRVSDRRTLMRIASAQECSISEVVRGLVGAQLMRLAEMASEEQERRAVTRELEKGNGRRAPA